METLTKENKKHILGKKSFFDNESSLVNKLMYLKGISYFDTILDGKNINGVIHLTKFPKAVEIKLVKTFKSYSIGIPLNEIKDIFLLQGSNHKLKILSNANEIIFSFKDADNFEIVDFFTEELKLIPKVVNNELDFETNKQVIEKPTISPPKEEVNIQNNNQGEKKGENNLQDINKLINQKIGISRKRLNIQAFIGLFIFGWLMAVNYSSLGRKGFEWGFMISMAILFGIGRYFDPLAFICMPILYIAAWIHTNIVLTNLQKQARESIIKKEPYELDADQNLISGEVVDPRKEITIKNKALGSIERLSIKRWEQMKKLYGEDKFEIIEYHE